MAFSLDGDRVAAGDIKNSSTIVWEAASAGDAEVANLPAGRRGRERGTAIRRTADTWCAGNADGGVTVWDARTFDEVRTLGDGEVAAAAGHGR